MAAPGICRTGWMGHVLLYMFSAIQMSGFFLRGVILNIYNIKAVMKV